jgi:hypothetical protein
VLSGKNQSTYVRIAASLSKPSKKTACDVLPKRRLTFTELHSVTLQKTKNVRKGLTAYQLYGTGRRLKEHGSCCPLGHMTLRAINWRVSSTPTRVNIQRSRGSG